MVALCRRQHHGVGRLRPPKRPPPTPGGGRPPPCRRVKLSRSAGPSRGPDLHRRDAARDCARHPLAPTSTASASTPRCAPKHPIAAGWSSHIATCPPASVRGSGVGAVQRHQSGGVKAQVPRRNGVTTSGCVAAEVHAAAGQDCAGLLRGLLSRESRVRNGSSEALQVANSATRDQPVRGTCRLNGSRRRNKQFNTASPARPEWPRAGWAARRFERGSSHRRPRSADRARSAAAAPTAVMPHAPRTVRAR